MKLFEEMYFKCKSISPEARHRRQDLLTSLAESFLLASTIPFQLSLLTEPNFSPSGIAVFSALHFNQAH
jgi:hypothetical protein